MKSEIWRVFYSRESTGKSTKKLPWLYIWSYPLLPLKLSNSCWKPNILDNYEWYINGIHSPKNDRDYQKESTPSAACVQAVFDHEEHRIKEHPVKSSSYPVDLAFTSIGPNCPTSQQDLQNIILLLRTSDSLCQQPIILEYLARNFNIKIWSF